MSVQGVCNILVITDEFSPTGKPFLRLKFNDDIVVDITTNLAEMIGGVGTGVRKREEDRNAKRK